LRTAPIIGTGGVNSGAEAIAMLMAGGLLDLLILFGEQGFAAADPGARDGSAPGERVALMLDHGVDGVVGILGALKAAPLEEAQYEYTRLFVNGYPKAACPPYESVYREGTMLGDSALDVHRVYADWGLEMAANEAGDHLAVMLEFLYYLSSLLDMAEDDEQRRAVEEAIGEFWKEHVGSWLPRFARDLEENAEMPFYARMGQVFSRVASLMS